MPAPVRNRLRLRPLRITLALLVLLSVAATARAGESTILWVDDDPGCGGRAPCFATIQSAIDTVAAGQTVRILPGDYREQLRLHDKNGDTVARARITIEADPESPTGAVVLRGTDGRCQRGFALDVSRAHDVTVRGLTFAGAGFRGIRLRGGSRQSSGIHFERNRVFGGGPTGCMGGLEIGRGTTDTAVLNNLLYDLDRHALRFRHAAGLTIVAGNTIARNGWNGVYLERRAQARLWNNLIAFNGTARSGGGGRFGIRARKATKARAADVQLRNNLVCGNAAGEIDGPVLDDTDAENLTPTGTEGSGVVAAAGCAEVARLFAAAAGPDGVLDSADDDFTLASGSPAAGAGLDPRLQGTTVPPARFEADVLAEGVRPGGDGRFDVGAVESTAPDATPTARAATPTTVATPSAATPSASPTPSVTPTLHQTPSTATPTGVQTLQAATPSPTSSGTPPRTPTRTPTSATTATPTSQNRAPVAHDDEYDVEVGTTLSVPAAGVLANDEDADADPLAATLVDPPTLGSLTAFGADGGFTFEAPAAFVQPGLHPVARRLAHGISGHGQVADFDHDGFADIVYPEFGSVRALKGQDLTLLFDSDLSDTTDVNVGGCSLFTGTTLAVGDVDGSGDVAIVKPINCDLTSVQGEADRFVALNGSQITAGKIRATWVSPQLTQPHPDAYANQGDPAPADPPIRPQFAAASYTAPTLARLDAGGGVKLLARRLVNRNEAAYFTRNQAGQAVIGHAGCRAMTGSPADENVSCAVTWILDAATGAVEDVLRGPNEGEDSTIFSWRPWRQNAPIVADLDGDGAVEIVSGGDVFRRTSGVWALDWHTTFEPSSVAVADMDGDGTQEVIQYQIGVTSTRTAADSGIFIYRHDGTLVRRIPVVPDNQTLGFVSIGDADGDGTPDILYTADGIFYVDRPDGRLLWLFLVPDRPEVLNGLTPSPVALFGRTGETAPQVYDLDLDGRPEVILNAAGRLYVFDGPTGLEEYSIDTEGGPFGPKTLALADFDDDGHVDILAMGANRWNCSNGGGPVPCLGNTLVVSGADHDWAPGPKVFNQIHYRANAVDDAAQILFAPDPRRDFRRAAQQGTVVDHRLKGGTTFTYRAGDGTASSDPAQVFVKIRPDNSPPMITSLPPTGFRSVSPYVRGTYQITATDPDPGDVVHYELVSTTHAFGVPNGVHLDPTTGAVDFYTGPCGSFGFPCDLGDVLVVVAAVDQLGARAEQHFAVRIGPGAATVPDVVGNSRDTAITAIQDAGLRARVVLEIADAAPAGTVIGQVPTGGTTGVALGASVDLTLSKGLPTPTPTPTRTPDPNATATPIPDVASIVVAPAAPIVLVGDTQAFTATAVFADDTSADVTASAVWTSGTTTVAADPPGGVATALAAGTTTVTATFAGVAGSASLTVQTRVPSDDTPPVAAITAPVADAQVIGPIDVVGTATDAAFLKYELALAPAGETTFTPIATSDTPVANGVLGKLDPTLLLNDLYTLRLTVFDRGDNSATAETTVQVNRNQKVGIFTITFQDLNVELAGLPISVTRTYDSRDKARHDFGVGWRLGVDTLRIRTNRVLGTGWVRNQSGLAVTLTPTAAHKVSVTLPDGTVQEFDMQVAPTSAPFALDFTNVVGFTPRPGTLGTLEALANPNLLIVNTGQEDELVDDGTIDTYDPQLWRYTSIDGTQIEIHTKLGVQKVTDRNGNTLTIDENGITHSSGVSVAFGRDADGRIVTITDPAGKPIHYDYDANGDLATVTDRVGNTTRFTYDRLHGLLDVIDPLGNRGARNDYDEQGRLLSTTDAEGNRIEFTHDVPALREVVRDRLGRPTTFEYDAKGDLTAKIDALGGRTEYTHDTRGNELSRKILGRIATSTYDAQNKVLTATDFDGNLTRFTYDAQGRNLTTTDADGRTITNTYDAKGNLTDVVDPDGGATHHTYDAAGNPVTTTDPLGKVTQSTWDGLGHLTSQTDALGHVTALTYDANGNPTSTTTTRTAPGGGPQTITSAFTYDDAGRLVRNDDPVGGASTTTYSPLGDGTKAATYTDALGHTRAFERDARTKVTQTTFADGSASAATYDAEGRPTTTTDRDGRTTAYEYDALGRLTKTVHPDTSTVAQTWDAAGRLLTRTDERGHATTYTYAPNEQTVTDALGNATVHAFDGVGNRITTTDALARTTTYAYGGKRNPTTTTFPDGTTRTITYDTLGRKTAETDQAGVATAFGYDAAGRLTTVTDALGGVTTYVYDEVGNLVAQTDANGHTTRSEHDAGGRLTKRIRPLGQQETFTYDLNGNTLSHTDYNGAVTTFAYDADNRLVTKTLPGNVVVAYDYTAQGHRTVAGDDASTFDTRGRVLQETKGSGEVVAYGYDAAGNRTSITTPQGTATFTYDALNRLASVTDTTGTTTYGYDAVGNLTSESRPNDVVTAYDYDDLNRLVAMTNTGPGGLLSSYTYTLGPAGNRVQVVEAGPATTGRTVTYGYDLLYRLIEEDIDEPGTAADQTIAYDYDDVGNRTKKTALLGTTTTETLYAYDDNDRLTSESTVVTIAARRPSGGLRVLAAGYGLSPFLALTLSLGLSWQRGGRRSARASRRLFFRTLVVLMLALASVFVPVIAHAGVVDMLTPRAAAAQSGPPSIITSTYDANGNLRTRSDGTHTDGYDYDAENRLVRADVQLGPRPGVVTYAYDADGIRRSQTKSGVTTTYLTDKNRDYAQVLVETTGGATVTYTHGHHLVSQTRSTGGTSFYLRDGQLSTRQLTSPAGAVTDTYTYDAFGNLLASDGLTPNAFLYTGEQLDPNVGFYYLRARYYAPALGRFVTTDPNQGNIFEPVSLHRYLYANANPVDNRDPSGRETLLEVIESSFLTALLAGTRFAVGAGILAKLTGTSDDDAVAFMTIAFVMAFCTVFSGTFLTGLRLTQLGYFVASRLAVRVLSFAQVVRLSQLILGTGTSGGIPTVLSAAGVVQSALIYVLFPLGVLVGFGTANAILGYLFSLSASPIFSAEVASQRRRSLEEAAGTAIAAQVVSNLANALDAATVIVDEHPERRPISRLRDNL